MYLSATKQGKRFRANGLSKFENNVDETNIHEVIESLSTALVTLESIREAELIQLLKLHVQNFPKSGIDFYKLTSRYEKTLIEHALKKTKGSQTKAAKLLNLRLTTLNAMIKRHGIQI